MKIKALTLWQPWASFMAEGFKKNETRSWATSYRGPLAIHAASNLHRDDIPRNVMDMAWSAFGGFHHWPAGKILCVVNLDSIEKDPDYPDNLTEAYLGEYGPGRYAWKTTLLHVFKEPIPCKGHQGLWDWEWVK